MATRIFKCGAMHEKSKTDNYFLEKSEDEILEDEKKIESIKQMYISPRDNQSC